MKHIIPIILVLSIFGVHPTQSEQVGSESPISVTYQYPSGYTVEASVNKYGVLEDLNLVYNKNKISISKNFLKNIINPNLSSLVFYVTEHKNTIDSLVRIKLEFDRRPYQWGQDFSRVTYYIRNSTVEVKEITVPVRNGEYKTYDEFKFHPENKSQERQK